MKPILFSAAGLVVTIATGQAAIDQIARADYRNDSGTFSNAASRNPGVSLFQGHLTKTSSHVATENGQPKYELRESSFGQPAATWVPYTTFANEVLNTGLAGTPAVLPKLYPDTALNRAQIAASSAAFRAKYLMYGDAAGDGTPAILNLFEQTFQGSADDAANPWFNDTDRDTVRAQIAVLREALARAPLDTALRQALLDCYYDWAVIEMQFARKYLARLATVRLGLPPAGTSPFIIDDEIVLMRKLVALTSPVLENFGELLSIETDGVEPADFDSKVPAGQPFGWYVFAHEQPFRIQTPTKYARDSGSVADVIDPVQAAAATFSGYKDYRTLLTIMGQFIQYKADLARLLGMRQGNGDFTEGRNALTDVQTGAVNDFSVLRRMFPTVNFDDTALDSTGVRAAFAGVNTALNDSVGVRGFLNGTTNVLGLDKNFLILLPTDTANNLFDTYDILRTKFLTNDASASIPTSALGVAKQKLEEAKTNYAGFRESVDKVQEQLDGLEDDFKARFIAITGFNYDTEGAQWNGIRPKANAPSEMATAERTIASLVRQNRTLGEATLQLLDDIAKANEAVTIAAGANAQIENAVKSYQDKTASAWTELHTWAGVAAGAAAASEAVYAAAGVDGISTAFSGGGTVAVIAATGAINTATQAAAAVRTSQQQQAIDDAAISFDAALAGVELPLAIQQAKLEVGALLREALANKLEIEENMTALAQTMADRDALINEVKQITEDMEADRSSLASKYYADPIHYLRAERALITADREFRRAQRWIFFTVRALEYKWQERFAFSNPGTGESWDAGSVLKMRNADELVEMLQKMEQWDNDRQVAAGQVIPDIQIISMRDHILTPNPDDVNLLFEPLPADDGQRFDAVSRTTIGKIQRFRQLLQEHQMPGGSVEIAFDTTQLQSLGQFFASGNYRDKIEWVVVNLVATDGPDVPSFNGRSGRMQYAGNTFFRTRVPVCPVNRTQGNTVNSGEAFSGSRDFPGEFVVAPFRFYQDTSFTGVFDLFDFQQANSLEFAYSGRSANDPNVFTRVQDAATGFQILHFKERSVAATRWKLIIDPNQAEISKLIDIELVVKHQARPRPQITCP